MSDMLRDVRYSLRGTYREPGFALAAIVMLSLAMGASSAVYTVADAVMFKMPFDEPARIVGHPRAGSRERQVRRIPSDRFEAWRTATDVLEATAAYGTSQPVLTSEIGAERLSAEVVTAGMFRVLDVPAQIGRVFVETDDRPGASPGAILNDRFWRSHFSSDPAVVGRPIDLDGVPTTIVGVMPPGFDGPLSSNHVDLWLLLRLPVPPGSALMVFGRLKKDVSVRAAEARLDGITRGLPGGNQVASWLEPITEDSLYIEARDKIRLLAGTVVLVLMIAYANVASLLLGRNLARRRELAIRCAIGAERWHLVRQLLVESVLLTGIGSAGGLLLASWTIRTVVPFMPASVPRVSEMHVDGSVLLFAIASALVSGAVIAVLPGIAAARVDLAGAMKSGNDASGTRRAARSRSALVIVETAVAIVVLSAASLLIAAFLRLNPTSPGFALDDRVTFSLGFSSARYVSAQARLALVDGLTARLESLPGVSSVTASSSLPLSGLSGAFPLRAIVSGSAVATPVVHYRAVSPQYLSKLDIPIVAGRDIDARDGAAAEPIAVVNETFGRRVFPTGAILGGQVEVDEPQGRVTRRIVGIAKDIRIFRFDLRPRPELFVPFAQSPLSGLNIVVHAPRPPVDLPERIRREAMALDPKLPLDQVTTLRAIADRSVDLPRFLALVMGGFAAIALVLAWVGVYAVAGWSVSQRRLEIGVRVALGATAGDVRRMILNYGAMVGAAGAAVGAAAAWLSAKMLETWLFGMPALQPRLIAAVALSFLALTVAACWIPARRAVQVDPMIVLRSQ